jgi:hypothetical protein
MIEQQAKAYDSEEVDFKYEGTAPAPDYLSYKEMMLVTQRWAPTSGWWSVLGVIVVGLCCSVPLTLWVLFRLGQIASP